MIRSSTFQRRSMPLLRQMRWSQLPAWPLGIALLGHILLLLPLTVSLHGIAGLVVLAVVPGWLMADILFPNERFLLERVPLAYALGISFMSMLTLGLHVLPGMLTSMLLLGVADLFILALGALAWRQRTSMSDDELLNKLGASWTPADTTITQRSTFVVRPFGKLRAGFSSFVTRWGLVLLLVVLASGLRLVELGYSEFQGDEARATLLAAGVAAGDDGILLVHQKAPGEVLVPSASYALLGSLNEFNARLPFALAGIVALLMAYSLGRRFMREMPGGEHYGHIAGTLVLAILTVSGYLIAFARLLQYQSVVLLCHLTAVWLCWRFYENGPVRNRQGGVALLQPYLLVASILCGVGILAHYEGILVVPALLLLFVLAAQRHRLSLIDQARILAPTAALLIAIPACFYVPFVRSPSFAVTSEYVLRRVSKKGGVGILYNNVPFYINISAFYHTIYQVLTLTAVLLTVLVAWLYAYVRPRPLAWAAIVLLLGAAIFSYWLPWTLTFATINFVVVLIVPPLAALVIARRTPAPVRIVVLWFACTFALAAFIVRKPGTHFYTSESAWGLLVAIAVAQWLGPRWRSWSSWVRGLLVGFGALVFALSTFYVAIVYVRNIPEYKRVFPDAKPAIYWTPYGKVLPDGGFFGFPYRAGWKTIGYLYQQGLLSGTYDSNEEDLITGWYVRGAPRCTWMPNYYFVAENVQDVRWIPSETIQQAYRPLSVINVGGTEKITIYQRNQGRTDHFVLPPDLQIASDGHPLLSGLPATLDGRGFEESFDRLTTPDMPTGPSLGPGLSIAVPGHQLNAAFGRSVQLHGYDIYSGPGSQTRYLSVYWSSTQPLPPTWEVQIQLAKADGTPLPPPTAPCGDSPPSAWSSSVRNFVEVAYAIIDTSAASATLTIIDTATGTPLPLSDGSGSRVTVPLH